MKNAIHLWGFIIFFFVTVGLYLIGRAFSIHWLLFETARTSDNQFYIVTGSFTPVIVGILASIVFETKMGNKTK